MSKRVLITIFVAVALCLSYASQLRAEDTKQPPKTEAAVKMPVHHRATNMVAVCACGKVFVPNEKTKYVEYKGKSYACCSDPCHEMGMKDPAAAAAKSEEAMVKLIGQPVPAPAPQKN